MTATTTAPQTLVELPPLRRVSFSGAPSLPEVAARLGCGTSAVVQMFPFFVDDAFTTVLASAAAPLWSAELITCLPAAVVRRAMSQEILFGFVLSQPRHTVYIDEALLQHEELFFCVDPPLGYATSTPETLRVELRARVISRCRSPTKGSAHSQPIA